MTPPILKLIAASAAANLRYNALKGKGDGI